MKSKKESLFVTLVLGLGLTLSLLGLLGSRASQVTLAQSGTGIIRVATTGSDAPGCGSETSPCRTVQYAVDQTLSGEEIRLASGVYTGIQNVPSLNTATFTATQVVVITKSVTIQGGYTTSNWDTPDPLANPTTLDAQGSGRVLFITGDISPMIKGLRLTGGNAAGLGGSIWGGDGAGAGVYIMNATASIINNQMFGNTAGDGGGLFLYASAATLSGNTVISNTAVTGGGLFLYAGNATLSRNTIASNTANEGGGLLLTVGNATFSGNTVMSNTADIVGGGLYLDWSNATLGGNTITGNTAGDWGGGLWLHASDATLTNNVVADNQADAGSGLYIRSSSPYLLHTTIARNSNGSGVYVTNSGVDYSTVTLTNTILVSHTVGITVTAGNTATLESTLWYSNITDWGGAGTIITGGLNYWGDPLFEADGYHLITGSTAIDKGVSIGVIRDIDGDLRPVDGDGDGTAGVDIGADELGGGQYIYLPLVIRNH